MSTKKTSLGRNLFIVCCPKTKTIGEITKNNKIKETYCSFCFNNKENKSFGGRLEHVKNAINLRPRIF